MRLDLPVTLYEATLVGGSGADLAGKVELTIPPGPNGGAPCACGARDCLPPRASRRAIYVSLKLMASDPPIRNMRR